MSVAPSKVIGRLSPEPSSRSTAPQGRHRVRHHSNLERISSRQQTHRHHLRSPPQLTCRGWSTIYDMWPANKRPTTGDRCGCMSIFTSTPSASRARVPPLTYVLLRSSLGLRSHGLETGPILRQGQDLQGPPEMRMEPRKMRIWLTCSTSWEGAEPHDRDRQTCDFSSSNITAFSYFVISIVT